MNPHILHFAKTYSRYFVNSVARYYPLNMPMLDAYFPWFPRVCCWWNEYIRWTAEGYLRHQIWIGDEQAPQEHSLNWWIPELYQTHPEFYEPDRIPCDEKYQPWEWTEAKIDEFAPLWTYEGWETISENESVAWTPELMEKYKDYINWRRFCFAQVNTPWSEEVIDQFVEYWDWPRLTQSDEINWTEAMLHKYADYLDEVCWYYLSSGLKILADPEIFLRWLPYLCHNTIHLNPHIRWDLGLLDALGDNIVWTSLSQNRSPFFPWSKEFLEQHKEQLDWIKLSRDLTPAFPWSIDLLETFKDRWHWDTLSRWSKLPWSEDLISHFEDSLDFVELSNNPHVPWNDALIDRYAHHPGFIFALSNNTTLEWSEELIARYADLWDWESLFQNRDLPWNWDWLNRFEAYLRSFYLAFDKTEDLNNIRYGDHFFPLKIWERLLQPELDDDSLMTLLAEITPELPQFSIDLMR